MRGKFSWRAVSTSERLAQLPRTNLPLKQEAVIYWSEFAVPFIRAADDADLFFLFGLIHAHLRLVQMELMRRMASGRLAEVFGPLPLSEADRTLRILGIDSAVPAMAENLSVETKDTLNQYVSGINSSLERMPARAPEFKLLKVSPQPWTIEDVLRVSRLASLDINWLYWFQLLGLAGEREFPAFYDRLRGQISLPSFGQSADLLMTAAKPGSNCFAVSGERSATGSAFLASDPHLGLHVPNVWIAASALSPGINAAGLMLPGIPAFLIGRNRDISWGGTNMLARSSVLYDASGLPKHESEETIRRRFFFPRRVIIRRTPAGPLISDIPALKKLNTAPIALEWRGYETSDEISAFLHILKAGSWTEFTASFRSYAVSGQNLLFAAKDGSIGQFSALETREGLPDCSRFLQTYSEEKGAVLKCADLPSAFKPRPGYLISANNAPSPASPNLSFFSLSNERFKRMESLLRAETAVTLDGVRKIQTDVFSEASLEMARTLLQFAGERRSVLAVQLAAWDGRYETDSQGAAAFQMLLHRFVMDFYEKRYGRKIADYLLSSHALLDFLKEDAGEENIRETAGRAFDLAERDFGGGRSWGEVHRLKLNHPFSAIPFLGRLFEFLDIGTSGASWTVSKTANKISPGKHSVQYGVSARFIADMSQEDGAYVVLTGGQDGWLGSANLLDQIELWQNDKYLPLPLNEETAARLYCYKTVLAPEVDV